VVKVIDRDTHSVSLYLRLRVCLWRYLRAFLRRGPPCVSPSDAPSLLSSALFSLYLIYLASARRLCECVACCST
jgi:hypothetical protein